MWNFLSKRRICFNCSLQNHYDTLGVSRTATAEQLKQAFVKKSKLLHPDLSFAEGKNTHDEFVAVNEAYSILSKQETRQLYDAGLPLSATIHNPPGGKWNVAGDKFVNPYRPADYKNPYRDFHHAWQTADRWSDYINSYGTSRAKREMEKDIDSEFWKDHWEFTRNFGGGGPQLPKHGKNTKLKAITISTALFLSLLFVVPTFIVAMFTFTPADGDHPVLVAERMLNDYMKYKMSHDEVQ